MQTTTGINRSNHPLPEGLEWAPLERLIGTSACGDYMYMGMTDGHIRLYKNRNTRRYLNIDSFGKTWAYNDQQNRYEPIPVPQALAWVNS